MDSYVGLLYDRFRRGRGDKNHRFFYLSDHGEQLGRRKIFGKQTLYEHALRVPFVAAGTGIPEGICRDPIGLLDISRTLLSIAGESDDVSDWHRGTAADPGNPNLAGHWIRIQQMLERDGEKFLAEAAVCGRYKVMRAQGVWHVYDLETDGEETRNLAEVCPDRAKAQIREAVEAGCFLEKQEIESLIRQERKVCNRQKRLKAWGKAVRPKEWAAVAFSPGTVREPIR
ncbi:MAG: sulfatase-like hydrolase/transferase [Hungatella sp.]|nr:sulfatase-like hydrolase/transferase [Hungatella sp.]